MAISHRPSERPIHLKVSNLDTLPARRPAGLFFQVSVFPVVWRAIGTIQKSFANRCAGVLPRCRVLIYARRAELCRQPSRRRRVTERFAHKRSTQLLPESPQLNAQRLTPRGWLRSLKHSTHPGYYARRSSTSSRPATKALEPQRKPPALPARVAIAVLPPDRNPLL